MARRRDVVRAVRRVEGGELPECFGYYAGGDVECDGEPPCAVRTACRAYRQLCASRGVDPQVERRTLPDHAVLTIVADALQRQPVPGATPLQARILRGWERFRGAVASELPPHVPIHDLPNLAVPGELYVQTWDTKGRLLAATLRVKGYSGRDGHRDLALARYWVQTTRRLEPWIELRCNVDALLSKFPRAVDLCERWQVTSPAGAAARQNVGACAVKVHGDRIEDVGRLLVRALEAGVVMDLRITRAEGIAPKWLAT